MKKFFSFLLVAVLVFSLTSCASKIPQEDASDYLKASDSTGPEPIESKPVSSNPTEPKEENTTAPVEDVSEFELDSIQQFENINFSVSSKWSKSSSSQGLYFYFEDGCMFFISASDDEPTLSDRDVFRAYSSGLFGENGGFPDASIQSEESTTILGNSGKLWRVKHSVNSRPHESLFLAFRYSSKIVSFICTNLDNLSSKDESYFLQIVDTISPSVPETPIESMPTEPKPTEPKPTEPKPTEPKPTETKPTEPKPTEPKPTETKPTEPKPTETKPNSQTVSQQNALKSANRYLSFTAFSYTGLIEQLEFEGFSTADATYAADNCGADWMEQALKKAKSYLESMPFSHDGLIKQLEFEDFTSQEAAYGADNCGADWMEQAVKKAKNYLDSMPFSHDGLIKQLKFEGFTSEQAAYGADNCGADWMEQAVKKAKSYLDIMPFSRSELIKQLEFEGFTSEQAAYGADQNGL